MVSYIIFFVVLGKEMAGGKKVLKLRAARAVS